MCVPNQFQVDALQQGTWVTIPHHQRCHHGEPPKEAAQVSSTPWVTHFLRTDVTLFDEFHCQLVQEWHQAWTDLSPLLGP
jgi:hypothetical protein